MKWLGLIAYSERTVCVFTDPFAGDKKILWVVSAVLQIQPDDFKVGKEF